MRQNTQLNMYTTTSKQQEGCTFKDSHPKCFITTNSTAKLSPGAVNRGDVHVLRAGADPGRGESGSSHGQIFSTLEYFALTFLKILD